MSYLEELLPEFRKGAKIRCSNWEKDKYIQKKGGLVATDNDILCDLSASDIFSNRWELYREPIDWDYIIKNKCLCWFYDADESNKRAGILKIISENINVLYWNNYDQQWFNCRPVRRDEVAFYEDKKDD
nr:MAG TPA: hypothetical protein [Myoviridae sp. ct3tv2]